MKPGPKSIPITDRFWNFVNEDEWWKCWEWTGAINLPGYGIIGRGDGSRKMMSAHRLSYLIHYRELPHDLDICHRCNNRKCVNPWHLYAGTRSENMQQAKREGRLKKTYRPWSAKRRAIYEAAGR